VQAQEKKPNTSSSWAMTSAGLIPASTIAG
jgi:hypothetical protein